MATYAVGDIQGCLKPLLCLLERVDFNPQQDQLWAAGDLVNRGPQSLETLRFIKQLGDSAKIVLGNHDLHLIAIYHGHKKIKPSSSLQAIVDAKDGADLIHWLRQQPLIHHDKNLDYAMVHAGIPPQWTLKKAKRLALEVEEALKDDSRIDAYLSNMYGDKPRQWKKTLEGYERLRVITNYLTRMRLCNPKGKLELEHKELGLDTQYEDYSAWFLHPERKAADKRIIFGHWAALMGDSGNTANIFPLDTGCVWGNHLRMMRLEDQQIFDCDCQP